MILDVYNWLSDFAHSNFLSNALSFTIDTPNHRFVFQHEGDIQKRDFQLMTNLVISSFLFFQLFDDYPRRMTENGLIE